MCLLAITLVRVRFLDTPLERDEGEFAYAGQLILAGEKPYTSMYAMKLPGIYLAYALIEVLFGQSTWAIHFGLLLVNLASILLVFVLARRMTGPAAGVAAAVFFAILTLSPTVQGTQTQAEHFVVFWALLGLLGCVSAETSRPTLWSFLGGLAFGLAFLSKQHGFVFPVLGLAFVALRESARWQSDPLGILRDLAALASGALIPLAICVGVFAATGTLGDFVFWTFVYPQKYVTLVPLEVQLRQVLPAIRTQLEYVWPLWLMGLLGLTAPFWYPAARRWRTLMLLLGGGCAAAIVPGGYYRHHYFVLAAPPIALLAAWGWQGLADAYRAQGGGRWLPLFLLALIVSWPIGRLAAFYAPLDANTLSIELYGACPFRDAVDLSKYLAAETTPADRIAILGSEPEVFFYARRRSATGHIYMYPLTEPNPYALRLQKQVREEIEAAQPKFIVHFAHHNSWFSQTGADLTQFQEWLQKYLTDHYDTVGVIEAVDHAKSEQHWGSAVDGLTVVSQNSIFIHRRRD